jgi:hypothetical protein
MFAAADSSDIDERTALTLNGRQGCCDVNNYKYLYEVYTSADREKRVLPFVGKRAGA